MSRAQQKQTERILPSHPGVDLLELIEDHGLTQYRTAKALGVAQTRIMQIVKGQRAITADTALRLGRLFGMSAEYWMNRQAAYDLECAEREKGAEILKRVQPLSTA
jgi:addiction module HigA family antidote